MKNHNDLVMAYIGFNLNRIDEIPEIIGGGGSDRPTKKLIPINVVNQKADDQIKPKDDQQKPKNEQPKTHEEPKPKEQPILKELQTK